MTGSPLAVSFECSPVREITLDATDQRVIEAIVEAVAELEGTSPTDLPPLYETINPDVVTKLVQRERTDSNSPQVLCFTYAGWNVFVRSDGTILVGDPTQKSNPTPVF